MNLNVTAFSQILPPFFLIFIFSVFLVIVDSFASKKSNLNANISIVALIFVIVQTLSGLLGFSFSAINITTHIPFIKDMLTFSNVSYIFDIIFCIAGLLVILSTKEYMSKVYTEYKEFYSLIFFAIFGMMCISNSNNLVVLFLGIETMSITFYAITGFVRNREVAIEGALKYFLLGAFASAFLLYGLAMIYGATGSMYYNEITASILNLTTLPLYLKLGIGLTIVGLLFKIAAFPFHQWAPDVYQAAATPVTGFMSTAGKIAALAGFVGIALTVMPANTLQEPIILLNQNIKIIVAVIAALTMIVGNVTALSQKNIKRMLAYSSVGHAGYMLMGIVANNAEGITSIIYYSLAYTFTQIGAFIVISVIEKKNEANLDISDYAGLSKTYPYLAATMAMFMFSLAGIPPFAGFFGKYFLFKAAIDAGFTWLTIIAVITSIISVYFYLSVIVQMYFRERQAEELCIENKFYKSKISITISAISIILLGIFPVIDFIIKMI